jgi:hypothetical protein
MKRKLLAGLIVAGLLMSGAALSAFARSGPGQGRNGQGYGGPPQSEEERAARQEACIEKNGGTCPNGGPKGPGYCGGQGQGKGKGAGYGWRRGARDGTGPRGQNGTCPQNAPAKPQK